ncbi:MAG: mandelate racemase/muconate lactonizing enzyme family protein [Pseudomonadota bacterium]
MHSFTLNALDVTVYRAPVERPIHTAFGLMTDRPAVIIRAVDRDGIEGFGEVWCNFPQCGAEHRARLVSSALAPIAVGQEWTLPEDLYRELNDRLHRLMLQTGEPGPMAQAIAGVDIAVWDLVARKAGQPLWRLLGGKGGGRMKAYASGINPEGSLEQALKAKADGYRAFKLKIGFGRERDLANLKDLRTELGDDVDIMVDANQAWDLDEAMTMSALLAPFRPAWLEEPLPADSSHDDWTRLAESSPIPLAAGENLRTDAAFDAAIASGAFAVIQPDLAKWGGLTAGLPLTRRIQAAGIRYCPHFLGGGVGLMASAHLLAAAGGDGVLEIDCNPNPLRTGLVPPLPPLEEGLLTLSDEPGLGVTPAPSMDAFAVPSGTSARW